MQVTAQSGVNRGQKRRSRQEAHYGSFVSCRLHSHQLCGYRRILVLIKPQLADGVLTPSASNGELTAAFGKQSVNPASARVAVKTPHRHEIINARRADFNQRCDCGRSNRRRVTSILDSIPEIRYLKTTIPAALDDHIRSNRLLQQRQIDSGHAAFRGRPVRCPPRTHHRRWRLDR